jgi:hypothetical protein
MSPNALIIKNSRSKKALEKIEITKKSQKVE